MNHTPLDVLKQLETLTDIVSLTLHELDSSKTGWYYKLKNEMEKARIVIRKAKGELK